MIKTENKFIKNHKIFHYKALANNVLVVAVINTIIKDFSVYIGGVKGKIFDNEYMNVAKKGTKLDINIAKILFPQYFSKYKWRY